MAPISAWAVGSWLATTLVRWWRSDDRSARWRGDGVTLALVGGTGVVLWLLPIVEQILHAPGNLSLLWRFASGSEARLGIAGAARIIGRQLGLTPPWLGFRTPLDQFVGGIDVSLGGWRTWPVLLVLPILALMRAARSRRWPDLEIVALFTEPITANQTQPTRSIRAARTTAHIKPGTRVKFRYGFHG